MKDLFGPIRYLILQGVEDWLDVSTLEETYVPYADVIYKGLIYEFTGEEKTCSPPIPIYRWKRKENPDDWDMKIGPFSSHWD